MKKIVFKIITPEKIVFDDEVYQITLPVREGEVTVLPDHIPYIAGLKSGEVAIRKGPKDEEIRLSISGGFIEFHDNVLLLLADTAEKAVDLDLERAEEAKQRAEKIMNEASVSDESYPTLVEMFDKEVTRVQLARKHRTHHRQAISTEDSAN
ncbi:ATP synthase F1 subunit epsilon [Candidatus Nomurabacteria bacterium]|nr:ATP synthase F1 subunit epsilon [Candidatus Nomurabacteria bacterium]